LDSQHHKEIIMRRLEDDIEDVTTLNDLRVSAKHMLAQGKMALAGIDNLPPRDGWDGSRGPIETAMLLGVQHQAKLATSPTLKQQICEIRLTGDLLTEDRERIPVMLAARVMQTLVASADDAFSTLSLLCYYRIVRELYVADSPDWSAGGARAGIGGEATAYVTSDCVRAVLAFVQSLRQTATYFHSTHRMCQRKAKLERMTGFEEWRDVEIERMGLAWYAATSRRAAEISLNISDTEPPGDIDLNYLQRYIDDLAAEAGEKIITAGLNFEDALTEIDQSRKEEQASTGDDLRRLRLMRSESAHRIARETVEQAVRRAVEAWELCRNPAEVIGNLQKIGHLFDAITHDVEKVLAPTTRFIATILDRELTLAGSTTKPVWDARELAFAAATYGALTSWREDERLIRACHLLSEAISEDGHFPVGRPYHSTPDGRRWHTLHFEVFRSFAELLEHVDVPVQPKVVRRMLHLFDTLRHPVEAEGNRRGWGWYLEHPPIPRRPILFVSVLAVLALEQIVVMLNSKINKVVLGHFNVKEPALLPTVPDLDMLLYPDFGRRLAPSHVFMEDAQLSAQSVGITLQQMRAHLWGLKLPEKYATPAFCGVFYGPPGTGKTTLLEALAKTSNVPLVELSPSDIAVAGQEAIESRARAIFQALSMLTKVVIIFDEFEPVLLSRTRSKQEGEREERSIFTFLTPGMLPKLTRLHQTAEEQRVVYYLVTNHYAKLDDAAIREGRFDHHIGIYNPDPLSRAGAFRFKLLEALEGLSPKQKQAFEAVVRASSGVSAVRLSKRWFKTASGDDASPSPWTSVCNGAEWDPPKATLPHVDNFSPPEEQWLAVWESDVQDETRSLEDIVKKPRRTWR
jgi:hypothetical protein